jgi:phage/plasmid-like protein (TIGR03299 family)
MSITRTDVNTAFAAERADQLRADEAARAEVASRLADGRLQSLGGDRYRIADAGSWDNGEVVTLNAGQLIPQHGLDETRGSAALYTTTPAWHRLGTVVPGGTTDVAEVLHLGGIDYEVHRRPVLFCNELHGPARVMPGHFVTVRDDTQAPLGVVGDKYQVLQNREAFEFLQDLVGSDAVVWESAGALREGRRVFISMRLPDGIRIDAAGINDEIVPFIAAINSHDGSSIFQVVATPWRPVCGNTERFALRDAHTRWGVRHTANAKDRFAEARRTLGLTQTYYQRFAAEEEALARTEIAIRDFRDLTTALWPVPPEGASTRSRANHQRRRQLLDGLWHSNTDALGATAYAAERAITEYLDWKVTVRPGASLRGDHLAARATAVMEGTADDRKATAHRRLLTLTHR